MIYYIIKTADLPSLLFLRKLIGLIVVVAVTTITTNRLEQNFLEQILLLMT